MDIDQLYWMLVKSNLIYKQRDLFRVLPLYISVKADYKNIDNSISLLESNLKRIYRCLDQLKEGRGMAGG